MKILDAGDLPLSNADVVDWIKRKRAQHTREDAEDKSKNLQPTPRPKNFMAALNRHERELTSSKYYPYTANPSVYSGSARESGFQKFALEAESAIQDNLESEWRERLQSMTREQVDKEFAMEQEKKCLTEPEMLMMYNHAPMSLEMLQPMIEDHERRFTDEEMRILVEVVKRTLRAEELGLGGDAMDT